MIHNFELKDWQKPENMHTDYVPPLVKEGTLSPSAFWVMAIHNTRLEIANLETELKNSRIRLLHAQDMLKRSSEK